MLRLVIWSVELESKQWYYMREVRTAQQNEKKSLRKSRAPGDIYRVLPDEPRFFYQRSISKLERQSERYIRSGEG